MQQRIKLPPIKGYDLTLTLKDPILTPDIEEESSGEISSLDINEDSVYEMTNGFFETLQDLSQGLKSAANGSYPGIVLTLSKEQLTYMGTCSLGTAQIELGFVLKLTEKRAEIQKYQESLLVLQRENGEMAQKLKELEKLYENLTASIPLKPDISFNKDSFYASEFNLTENSKTATSISKGLYGLDILPKIPSSGEHCYSLKINEIKQGFSFGILNNDWEYYLYSTFDGRIFGRADQAAIGNGPFGRKDSIVKMIVNMDQGTLAFYVDNRQVNLCPISKQDKFSAFIYFENVGDSVSLL